MFSTTRPAVPRRVFARVVVRVSAVCLTVLSIGFAVPATASAAPLAAGTPATVEDLPTALGVPGMSSAKRLTYWTVGATGSPALSSGELFLPQGEPPSGGWPVISWSHGTVGVGDQCAPSRLPQLPRDSRYLAHWLAEGYAIVATDYAGLGTPGLHAYLEKNSSARNVIDMVRAGRAVDSRLSNRWMAIGQSQGGHAALQAAAVATSYAPELDYRGVVATGAPSNLESAFMIGGPWIPELGLDGLNIFAAYVLSGLRETRPDLDVNSYLTPYGKRIVDGVADTCPGDLRLEHGNVGAMLAKPVGNPTMFDALTRYLSVPVEGYDRPIFLGQGVIDIMVPSPLSVKLLADMRAHNVDVTYVPYLFSNGEFVGHGGSMIASIADSTPFVHRLLDPIHRT